MTKIRIDISDIDAKFWEDVEREKAIRRANQASYNKERIAHRHQAVLRCNVSTQTREV